MVSELLHTENVRQSMKTCARTRFGGLHFRLANRKQDLKRHPKWQEGYFFIHFSRSGALAGLGWPGLHMMAGCKGATARPALAAKPETNCQLAIKSEVLQYNSRRATTVYCAGNLCSCASDLNYHIDVMASGGNGAMPALGHPCGLALLLSLRRACMKILWHG